MDRGPDGIAHRCPERRRRSLPLQLKSVDGMSHFCRGMKFFDDCFGSCHPRPAEASNDDGEEATVARAERGR